MLEQCEDITFDVIFSEPTAYDAVLAEEMMFGGNVAIAQAIRKDLEPIEVLPEFTEVAKLGHIVARPDPDGIIREGISYIGDFPSLSVAMLEIYQDTLDLTLSAPHTRSMLFRAKSYLGQPHEHSGTKYPASQSLTSLATAIGVSLGLDAVLTGAAAYLCWQRIR